MNFVLALFAVFTLSPTPGAVHGCDSWIRAMVPAVCAAEEPPPCFALGPMAPVPCAVLGNGAYSLTAPIPGEAFMFCIFAENSGGRSGCAEPVGHF